ncbi:MAG: hypothetical protein WD824_24850 [Cyclobacteriaceae bacterium]
MDSLVSALDSQRVMLPNGWSLSPAGKKIPLGDLPLNLVVSAAAKLMAVTNNGQSRQTITLIDPVNETILDETEINKSWYGLVFNQDGTKLFVSGGNDNMIVIFDTSRRTLVKSDSIILGNPWPVRISPTGLAIDDVSNKPARLLFQKMDSSGTIVREPGSATGVMVNLAIMGKRI